MRQTTEDSGLPCVCPGRGDGHLLGQGDASRLWLFLVCADNPVTSFLSLKNSQVLFAPLLSFNPVSNR